MHCALNVPYVPSHVTTSGAKKFFCTCRDQDIGTFTLEQQGYCFIMMDVRPIPCMLLLEIITLVLIKTGAFPVKLTSTCGICVSNEDGLADCKTVKSCVRVFTHNNDTVIREVYVSMCTQKLYPRKLQMLARKPGHAVKYNCCGQ